jgi:hypothetical protein
VAAAATVNLYLAFRFARVRQTLRLTAMKVLLSDHVWSVEELVGLLDRRSAEAA